MNISKASLMKKGLVFSAAALSTLVTTNDPAAAHLAGAGVFTGWEYAPRAITEPALPTLCATYDPSPGDPLLIRLAMTGTFDGSLGTGIATFTNSTTNYSVSPEGTYSDSACTSPSAVPGTLAVSFGSVGCTSEEATYERRGTTAVVIMTAPSSCNGHTVVFTGAQEVCPPNPPTPGCPTDPNPSDPASGFLQGDYVQG